MGRSQGPIPEPDARLRSLPSWYSSTMSESISETKKRYLVTSALPYANGPLHVGQIVGAYRPPDALVRYPRARGEDVVYVGGPDEQGVPVALTAEREGKDPQDVVDYWWANVKETFA